MSYIDGFVIPVASGNKEAYRDMAERAAVVFREFGATRVVECWGDDVPQGKLTDFHRAVQAEEGDTIVFSWVEYPSREVRDAAQPRIMADPRMNTGETMPFDGKRMIWGGFSPFVDA